VPTALDSVRYFGAHLSDNIAETPEGYRICRNAVIGRTGFQTYKISELADPEGILGDDRGPDEEIQVWRDPKEVFSPGTLASFEGKTFTLTHPDDLLDPDNERRHHVGHVQNVRAGTEPLESGDLPMLADIIVTDRDAIRAIDSGSRELSCGYTYKLAKEGYRYDQRQILGNHVALVPKGRAGGEARINDAAPTKESPVKNIFKHLLGLGFQTYAKDAKPEDLAEAMDAVRTASNPTDKNGGDASSKKLVSMGKTKDGVEIFKLVGVDADGNVEGPSEAMDRNKRLHDALDKMILNSEKAAEDREAQEDASVAELQSLMNGFLGEKEKEATDEDTETADDAHPEKCRCNDCMDNSADDADKDEDEGKDGKEESDGKDAEIVNPEPVLTPEERPKSMDAQLALNTLNALKPFVARAKDKKLTAAFDTAVNSIKKALKGNGSGKGGYIEFRTAASKASDRATESETVAQRESREFDEKMAKFRKESRDRNIAARRR
jgi:hypothetical protein